MFMLAFPLSKGFRPLFSSIAISRFFTGIRYPSRLVKPLLVNRHKDCLCATQAWLTTTMDTSKSFVEKSFTAGIIVIGDELLKGQVQDVNTFFLCKKMREVGVRVEKVSVIGDNVEEIRDEIREFSAKYKFVLTAGGIGPTHDDRTFEGVAQAFGLTLRLNAEIANFCEKWFHTTEKTDPVFKLAVVPETSALNYGLHPVTGERNRFPLVSVRNVYVFPGVPELLVKAMEYNLDIFRNPSSRIFEDVMYLSMDETSMAVTLNGAVEEFSDVRFGSYPEFSHNYYKVRITMESKAEKSVVGAKQFLLSSLPEASVVNYDPFPTLNCWEKHKTFITSDMSSNELSERAEHAFGVFKKTFQEHKPSEVAVFFNGGKDCTVVLHLLFTYLQHHDPEALAALKFVYVKEDKLFAEVQEFIEDTSMRYGLSLRMYRGPLYDGLKEILEEFPGVTAAIMGTRFGDPRSESQTEFHATDIGWPSLIRVNPILRWNYGLVWEYIRGLTLPYCRLYDKGYSSIGSVERTHRNPRLLRLLPGGKSEYRPAYELTDFNEERSGRS